VDLCSCLCLAQLCSSFRVAQRFTAAITATFSMLALATEGRSIPSSDHRDLLAAGHWLLATGFCEYTMNFPCGKQIHHPRTKPVIAGDTTYGVSLLTDTISGSNFAIPWAF
jgi:hypothetical protein